MLVAASIAVIDDNYLQTEKFDYSLKHVWLVAGQKLFFVMSAVQAGLYPVLRNVLSLLNRLKSRS